MKQLPLQTNHQDLTSFQTLPSIPDTREWTPTGQIDSLFSDDFNFDLNDDTVGVIISVVTLVSMVFLTDTVFRVIVRYRGDQDKSPLNAVHRHNLLSSASNPLDWVGSSFHVLKREIKREVPTPIKLPSKVVIVFAGVFIVAMDLFFIFMSTTRNVQCFISKDVIPSFQFADTGQDFLYKANVSRNYTCLPWPYTEKQGFLTMYPINVCSKVELVRRKKGPSEYFPSKRSDLWIEIEAHDHLVMIYVSVFGLHIPFHQYIRVEHPSGFDHLVLPRMRVDEVLGAVKSLLKRRNITLSDMEVTYDPSAVIQPNFHVWFLIKHTSLRLSPEDLLRGRNVLREHNINEKKSLVESAAWCLYFGNAVRSTIQLSGRNSAVNIELFDEDEDVRLSKDFAPVILQRPRISVLVWLGILAGIVSLWALVSLVFKYKSRIDHRIAWCDMFESMDDVSDLQNKPEEIIDLS